MLDLPFGDECFDVVIEKGTMVNVLNFFSISLLYFFSVVVNNCIFYLRFYLS